MKVPTHWARVTDGDYTALGWSTSDEADARRMAEQRLHRVVAAIKAGESPESYPYGKDAIREWCVERFHDESGNLTAAITRNGYGAWVLNAANLMIADVDLPEPRPAGFIGRLFGRKHDPADTQTPEQRATAALENLLNQHPDIGVRTYRTHSGLRHLFTHAPQKPDDPAVLELLKTVQCDPKYVQLCKWQRCFRARLSPKPWRCGVAPADPGFPWIGDDDAERYFKQWDADYGRRSEPYATCRFLAARGNPTVDPSLAHLIELHDDTTKANSDLPLA
jgi:hypothetical protein